MALRRVSVSAKLPFLEIGGEWEPDDAEQEAAWEMYIELITRTSVVELAPGEGILREALNSLYSLFATTRDILRRYGPSIAQSSKKDSLSFGHIAVAVLNGVLRPVLAKWHPRLQAYESTRPEGRSIVEHEREWPEEAELRAALDTTRLQLRAYAALLGEVTGAPNLIDAG